jgi:hypothetical protein
MLHIEMFRAYTYGHLHSSPSSLANQYRPTSPTPMNDVAWLLPRSTKHLSAGTMFDLRWLLVSDSSPMRTVYVRSRVENEQVSNTA